IGATISNFPIVGSNDIESVSKATDLKNILVSVGMCEDLDRPDSLRKFRSGLTRRRARKNRVGYRTLIVTGSEEDKICQVSASLSGVHVRSVKQLSVLDLAPGSRQIRLTVYSENAIEKLRDVKQYKVSGICI